MLWCLCKWGYKQCIILVNCAPINGLMSADCGAMINKIGSLLWNRSPATPRHIYSSLEAVVSCIVISSPNLSRRLIQLCILFAPRIQKRTYWVEGQLRKMTFIALLCTKRYARLELRTLFLVVSVFENNNRHF